jgi:transposase-like protein
MSARNQDAEVAPCRKRRRRWTAEQKRQIVAESLEPGASVATVATRHGISSGQFYAWRQQLLLRGETVAGSDSTSRLVGGDVTTAAPRGAIAIPAPRESDIAATPIAPTPRVQPDAGIILAGGVLASANESSGIEDAHTTNRRSVLNSPIATRTDRGQGDQGRNAVL